jgi:hypothetical protein
MPTIRERRPENPAADIEEAQQARESSRRRRGDAAFEDFLNHRRRNRQHGDAGGDVHAEHAPQKPELRRLPRDVNGHRSSVGRDVVFRRRRPPRG